MQLTDEILKERKTGIGGSDCAAVLGYSKWSTPLDIYLSKIDPESLPVEQTDAMRDGHDIEPIVIKRYEETTNCEIDQPNKIFRSEKYPWLIANVDGLVKGKDIILEAKSTKFFNNDEWGDENTDNIPDQYLFQLAHYCLVLNKPQADLAAWSFGQPLRIYKYTRDKGLEEQIIDLTHDFWKNHVEKLIPPLPVNDIDLLKLYKTADETKTLIADDELYSIIVKYADICNSTKNLELNKENLKNKIKMYMANNAYITGANGERLVSWKNQTANRFNIKAFKEKYPLLYKQFETVSQTRALRLHVKEIS